MKSHLPHLLIAPAETCDGRRVSLLKTHPARLHKQMNTWRRPWTWPHVFRSTDDCRLLLTLGAQLCQQRDGRLGVRQRRAVHRRQLIYHIFVTYRRNRWMDEKCRRNFYIALRYADVRYSKKVCRCRGTACRSSNTKKSILKRLAIGNDLQGHSRSLQLLLLDRPYTSITSC